MIIISRSMESLRLPTSGLYLQRKQLKSLDYQQSLPRSMKFAVTNSLRDNWTYPLTS